MASATLYINNLNEKPSLKRTKQELQAKLEPYGEIISLILKKKVPLKGQAFVTFKSVDSASRAQKALDKTDVLGKVIRVTAAKDNSIAYYKATLSAEEFESYIEQRQKKRKAEAEAEDASGEPKKKRIKLIRSDVPHNVLLLQNLSSSVTKETLVDVFSKHDGFANVRLIKARNLSFIDFNDVASAKKVMAKYVEGAVGELANDDGQAAFITYAKQ